MNLTLTPDELRVLRRFLTRFPANPEIVAAIYISPAARLRQQAEEMEQDEKDYPILQGIIRNLNRV